MVPVHLVFVILAVLFAISIHEFSHGYVAYLLGDPTPKYQGRLTLNPFAHMDLLGMLMFIVFRFGWAKPVMVNPYKLKGGPRKGMLLVALAGPLANLAVAWVCLVIFQHWPHALFPFNVTVAAVSFLQINVIYNLSLAAFNLIPIPPLDGSKILYGLLPKTFDRYVIRLEQYGPVILILMLVTGMAGYIFGPIVTALRNLLLFLT